MPGPIIVGVDGSPTSRRAAEKARDLAVRLEAPLHVVSAHTENEITHIKSGSDQWIVSSADNARRIAEDVARQIRTPEVEIVPLSAHGKPSEALIGYAERAGAQMIVVGNQRMREPHGCWGASPTRSPTTPAATSTSPIPTAPDQPGSRKPWCPGAVGAGS